jgi:hypothetical protein
MVSTNFNETNLIGGTVWIPLRRCYNCSHDNAHSLSICSSCGYLFIRQATEEEINRFMDNQFKLKMKSKVVGDGN